MVDGTFTIEPFSWLYFVFVKWEWFWISTIHKQWRFYSQIDVEVDNEQKDDDVTQTAAQELVSAPPGASLPPKSVKQEPTELNTQVENPDRPNTANSFSSGTSADSIPPLPPLSTTTNRKRVIMFWLLFTPFERN